MNLETKVGAFFIGTIAVAGVLVLRMEKWDVFGKSADRQVLAEFTQVAGLNAQSAVRVAGVKVGTVERIALDKGKAQVFLALPKDFAVYSDAKAQLSSIGILGEKYIELDPGHPEAGTLSGPGPIQSRNGVSMDTLMETLAGIGQDVKGVTYALNQSMGGEQGREKLDEIIDNIRVLTAEFRAMSQENHGTINRTLANAEAITAEVRDRLPRIAQQFEEMSRNLNGLVAENRPELKGTLQDVRKLAANFQSTSENLKSITDKLNRGEGTVGKLLTDETTINKINAAVDSVNDMLGGFNKMEMRLDMNAASWTKRSDSKVGLGLEIAPRHDYWYSIALSSTPDGKVSESSSSVTSTSGTETKTYVNTDQTFTVSALFNKRLGENFVISGGLMESKGGVGAEFRALNDTFRLGAIAYDFSKRDDKPKPRYRITTSYEFWNGLYGQMGVQDLANKDLRTFFIGGGIRWKDNDLKKIIGLASSGK
ncbi:MlaD family protein [Holophaga foetida]|uniref:MlaD family protein n=1 Tax=Holophaga foetida TaxID=35839 RepID=UPI00024750AB|nr:MlaD family protein [Holophaga foetida]